MLTGGTTLRIESLTDGSVTERWAGFSLGDVVLAPATPDAVAPSVFVLDHEAHAVRVYGPE